MGVFFRVQRSCIFGVGGMGSFESKYRALSSLLSFGILKDEGKDEWNGARWMRVMQHSKYIISNVVLCRHHVGVSVMVMPAVLVRSVLLRSQ
jgi:hypothetical protein